MMIAYDMNDGNRAPRAPLPAGFTRQMVPPMLGNLPQWICWKWVLDSNGTWTKVPINPATSRPCSVTDRKALHTIEEAHAVASVSEGALGLGFVMIKGGGIVGIDFDGCVDDDGTVRPDVVTAVERLRSYTEVTPSGKGLRVFVQAVKPPHAKCKRSEVLGIKCVEVYEKDRFFTFTGNHLEGTPTDVEIRQPELDEFCGGLWSAKSSSKRAAVTLGNDEVVRHALAARNGDKFRALYEFGDTSAHGGDDSAADMALCCHLAFWCGKDAGQIDQIFRDSKLMREKWDEPRGESTYGAVTIARAIEQTKEVFKVGGRRVEGDTRPRVMIDADEHIVSDEVVEHLKHDASIFRRGDMLVKVVQNKGNRATIVELQKPTLRYKIVRQVFLYVRTDEGDQQVHPTDWLISDIHCRGDWPEFRELQGLALGPILRPDGSVFDEGGYDPVTRLWLDKVDTFPALPSSLTREDAIKAVKELEDVFLDFPFENEGHRTAALASALTIVGRAAFEGPAPLFLVDANVRGSGKTLLASVAGVIATGVDVPVTTYAEDEELRKAVTATAIAADPVVLLDNLSGSIGCATLDRLLTSTVWRDRLLGRNALVCLPMKSVWLATGNNVVLKADTARRTVHVRLVSPLERPEFREGFRHPDLLAWARQHRARLYMAALTILAAYKRSGEKFPVSPMGSFEGWNELVRASLLWAGCADFTASGGVEVADTRAEALDRLLRALEQLFPGSKVFYASDVAQRLSTEGAKGTLAQLQGAMEELEGSPPGVEFSATQIGIVFRGVRDWVVGQRRLVSGERSSQGVQWRVLAPREPGCDDDVDDVGVAGR